MAFIDTGLTAFRATIRKRWRWVASSMMCVTAVAAALLFLAGSRYEAHVLILVWTPATSDAGSALVGQQYAVARASTYADLARGYEVTSEVIRRADIDMSRSDFQSGVQAVAERDLVSLTVHANSATDADRAALALFDELSQRADDLEDAPGNKYPHAQLVMVDPPHGVPDRLMPPGAAIVAAAIVGALLGMGGAVLHSWLEVRVRHPAEIATLLSAPVLCSVRIDGSSGDVTGNAGSLSFAIAYLDAKLKRSEGTCIHLTAHDDSSAVGRIVGRIVERLADNLAVRGHSVALVGIQQDGGVASFAEDGTAWPTEFERLSGVGFDRYACGPDALSARKIAAEPAFAKKIDDLKRLYTRVIIWLGPDPLALNAVVVEPEVDYTLHVSAFESRIEALKAYRARLSSNGMRSPDGVILVGTPAQFGTGVYLPEWVVGGS